MITNLSFSQEQLNAAVMAGRVTMRPHPTLPLRIYNYSPETAYSNDWDEVTLTSRGLILDDNYNVVARPWKKFFNLGQVNLPIQFDSPVEVTDKKDGSLGILYPDLPGIKNRYSIATRGSFASEQAMHATFVWKARYQDMVEVPDEYTFLFEIIFPANRIVLDYEGMDDLILLGAVQNEHGYYYGPLAAQSFLNWPGPVAKVFEHKTLSDAMGDVERKNAEGFVIRSHNFMVKIKQPDYLDLHRLVTNASPKTVWEQLRADRTAEQIVSAFPDEFHSYVESMIDPLIDAYRMRAEEIINGFLSSVLPVKDESRKKIAQSIVNHKDKKYFFLLLDARPIDQVLWQELKPREAT